MWYYIRFILIWLAFGLVMGYYNVPPVAYFLIIVLVAFYGINEIYECHNRWNKWDE